MATKEATLDADGKAYSRPWLVLTIVIGTFATFMTQTLLTTAFPTLMNYFHVSALDVQWLTTGFLLVSGVMIPISAWLLTRFNSKWLYISSMIIFGIGTLMAYLAPSFSMLLIARLIQALGVGISAPVFQTLMASMYPPESRGSAMGTTGIVIGLAPAIGPTLAGWIIETYNWRDLFLFILPIDIVVIIVSFFTVRKVLPTNRQPIDWWSAAISTLGFGSLLYSFSTVGALGWGSPTVIGTLIVGLVFTGLFIWRQLHMQNPLLELRVFTHLTFTLTTSLTALAFMSMVGVEMILPMYIQTVLGYSAMTSGLILFPGALMMGLMSPITGKVFDKIGVRRLAITGMTLLTLGTAFFITIGSSTPILWITVIYAVRIFGLTMVTMPSTAAGINALPYNLIPHATASNSTLRQVTSSVGTALLVSIYTSTMQGSMPKRALLAQSPLRYHTAVTNATLIGYRATFLVALLFCALGLLLTFFVKAPAKEAKAA